MQLSFHSVAVVLTLVTNKNIHKRNYTNHSTNSAIHSKYKYTYYQNTHTYTRPHITKQVETTTVHDINQIK